MSTDAGHAALSIIHIGDTVDDFFEPYSVTDNDIQLGVVIGWDDFAQKGGMSEDEAERGAQFMGAACEARVSRIVRSSSV